MTDYNTKSDAEINELVSARRHEKLVGDFGNGEWCKTPDYCNNPSDIMPIAIEHGISIAPIYSMNSSGQYERTAKWRTESWDEVAEHTNPYRAIAICYLMMEGE